MKYLLDSNICIHFLRGKYNIIDKLNEVGIDNCAISEITLAELVFGAEKSDNPNKNHKLIEKFIGQNTKARIIALPFCPVLNLDFFNFQLGLIIKNHFNVTISFLNLKNLLNEN